MAAKFGVNSSRYKDALERTSTYNSRLVFERRQRSPFLDAQTGVAQVSCHLWKSKLVRRAPAYPYQLYSYPGRRWKTRPKKIPTPAPSEPEIESADEQPPEPEIITADPVVITTEINSSFEEKVETVEVQNPEGSDENSEEDSEDDDEDESLAGIRRPGRPGRPPKRAQPPNTNSFMTSKPMSQVDQNSLKVRNYTKEELAKMSYEDRQKPYICEICEKRYKNGPGLKYHYTHYNHDQDESSTSETTEPPPVLPSTTSTMQPEASSPFETSTSLVLPNPAVQVEPVKEADSAVTSNDYCDFCLGDVNENKKTLLSEELLSCADCGRSGHPTCLQFTAKLINNVKKYRWQCIECKSCTLCGTSDNDDQLLFCDDCDRGYHMYCLKPPMETPPEGSWICKLCEEEDV